MCVDGIRLTATFPPLPVPIFLNSTDTSIGKNCKKVRRRNKKNTKGAIGVDEPEVSGGSKMSSKVARYISGDRNGRKH